MRLYTSRAWSMASKLAPYQHHRPSANETTALLFALSHMKNEAHVDLVLAFGRWVYRFNVVLEFPHLSDGIPISVTHVAGYILIGNFEVGIVKQLVDFLLRFHSFLPSGGNLVPRNR